MSIDNRPATADLPWRKSSYSGVGNQCVEVAQSGPTLLIRDSKNPEDLRLSVTRSAWKTLIVGAKRAADEL